jgi:hypothetical protein
VAGPGCHRLRRCCASVGGLGRVSLTGGSHAMPSHPNRPCGCPGSSESHRRFARWRQQEECQWRRAASAASSPVRPSAAQATMLAVPGGMSRPQPGQTYVLRAGPAARTIHSPSAADSRAAKPDLARASSTGRCPSAALRARLERLPMSDAVRRAGRRGHLRRA